MRRRIAFGVLLAATLGMDSFLMPWAMADTLNDAVADYRAGDYKQALGTLQKIHGAEPMNIRATYYLAITEARLGRYDQARGHYGEVLTLAPQSPEADMATQGMAALPANNHLDAPPEFSASSGNGFFGHKDKPAEKAPKQTAQGGITAQQVQQMQQEFSQYGQQTGGMDPQDMMALQMMMGGNNNGMGGNGGMDPMMWMYMMQQGNDPNNPQARPQMDPNIMSTMMMNQMLNNFSFESNNNNK